MAQSIHTKFQGNRTIFRDGGILGGIAPPGGEREGISNNGMRHKLLTTQKKLYTKFHENQSITSAYITILVCTENRPYSNTCPSGLWTYKNSLKIKHIYEKWLQHEPPTTQINFHAKILSINKHATYHSFGMQISHLLFLAKKLHGFVDPPLQSRIPLLKSFPS